MTDNYLLVDGTGKAIEITGEIKIGRSKTNDVVLTDQLASRHHATIFFEGDEMMIRDEQSVNGTIVNGLKVAGSAVLGDQDKVQFGDEVFIVRAPLAESKTMRASDTEIAELEQAAKSAAEAAPGATVSSGIAEPFPPETRKDNKKTVIIIAGVAVFLCLCCAAVWLIWKYVIPAITG